MFSIVSLILMGLNTIVTYHFTTRVRKTYWWLVGITMIMSIVIIYFRYPDFNNTQPYLALFQLAVIASFPLTIFLRLILVIRPHIYASYSPRQTHLVITRGKNEQRIDYSQVESVWRSWLPMVFGGGLTFKLKSGLKFQVLSLIEGHEEIIEDYIRFLPDNVIPKSLRNYRETAKFSGHQRQRIFETLLQWQMVILLYLVAPIFYGLLSVWWNGGISDDLVTQCLLFFFISTVTANVVWWFEETFYLLIFNGQRKNKLESGVRLGGRVLHVLILLFFVWLI